MLFIYRFRRGFLRIEIRGDIAEALLNICAKNGIPLWSIRRRGSVIRSFISVSDFRRLPALVAGSGLRVHILARYGLPFFTERYKETALYQRMSFLPNAETSAFMRACVKAIYRPQAQSCNYCFGITAFHGALLISRAAI